LAAANTPIGRLVVNHDIPTVVEAIDKEVLPIKAAAHVARLPPAKQEQLMAFDHDKDRDH
jgi:hypothetical protein